MMTVTISINAQPIYTRTAVNTKLLKTFKNGWQLCEYTLDDGSVITHIRQNGAVELAQKMLETIKEVKKVG